MYRYDYFQRFLFQKVNQGYRLEQIFSSMGLGVLLDDACGRMECSRRDRLTEDLARRCREYLLSVWEQVSSIYSEERLAAGRYLKRLAEGSGSAAAVDVGWAVLHLPFTVYGLVMGTNTAHNLSPDVSEGFFFSGQMESYLFSQQKNRDLWKYHDLNRKHNLYMELLFTSAFPSLKGFGTGAECSGSEGKKDTPGRSGRSRKGSWIMWRIIEGISEICSQRGPGRSPGGTPMLPSCSFWETEKHRGGWKRASAGIQIRMWNKMKASGMKK